MTITERVILSVKGSVDEWKDALKVMLQTLKAQDGYLHGDPIVKINKSSSFSLVGSLQKPQPNFKLVFTLSIQLKDLTNFYFKPPPAFQDTLSQITPALAAAPKIVGIESKPYAPKDVIDAHLVQMLTIEQGAAFEDDLRDKVTKFKDLEGCTGVASGISSDDVDVDGKGKVFVAAAGWDSLKASEEAKVTMTGGAESHHVNFGFRIKELHGFLDMVTGYVEWRTGLAYLKSEVWFEDLKFRLKAYVDE